MGDETAKFPFGKGKSNSGHFVTSLPMNLQTSSCPHIWQEFHLQSGVREALIAFALSFSRKLLEIPALI
jgi:hypothetical protein